MLTQGSIGTEDRRGRARSAVLGLLVACLLGAIIATFLENLQVFLRNVARDVLA